MSFRFIVGDLVRVFDDSEDTFYRGTLGKIITVEYTPDDPNIEDAEYMVEFESPVDNPHYSGNEEWESPTYPEGYFSDRELEPRVAIRAKRTSGFGKFISDVESRHSSPTISKIEDEDAD